VNWRTRWCALLHWRLNSEAHVKNTITKSDWLAAQQCLGMAFRADETAPVLAEIISMRTVSAVARSCQFDRSRDV